ncbi:TPA: hypothetical protein I7721_20535 [Vibrio vulnificus]|nr:hypothetical protein [Vibrio vulnificus]
MSLLIIFTCIVSVFISRYQLLFSARSGAATLTEKNRPGIFMYKYTVFLQVMLICSGNNREINLMNIRNKYQ